MKTSLKRIAVLIASLIVLSAIYVLLSVVPIPTNPLPTSVKMVALPSPPHYKEVTSNEDIHAIFNMIKDSDLKPVMHFEKGWQVRLVYKGGDITVINNYVNINGRWFKAKDNISDKLRIYYEDLKIEEKPWQ
ncbi:MAG TPA: hypothetical protein DCS67_03120 [Clostridiales bacterium UBA8960]|jgi:hypothetical protein|nr:hypothetical protein [Clostridiales bacterium UBA8960]